jgi:Ca-activated chloride channel family protein
MEQLLFFLSNTYRYYCGGLVMRNVWFAWIGLIIFSTVLFGQNENWKGGRIIPFPPMEIRDPVTLKSEDSKITINDGIAKVIKSQVFKNKSYRAVECKYIFPLPNDAFIDEFSLYIDNERIKGEILSAEEAKKIYEDIVRKYRDPALLEMIGNNLFQANIFPFFSLGERKIDVRYTQILKPSGKTYRLLYPIGKTGKDLETKISLDIEINGSNPLTNIYSPTHDITVQTIDEKKARIVISLEGNNSSSDFILYYSVSQKNIEAMNLVYDNGKEDPYFMLQFSPKLNMERKSIAEKNIVFILDISGSMTGKKIEQAKNALSFCMNNLNKKDHYSVISFSNSAEVLIENHSAADENTLKADINKISAFDADGGTNLDQALGMSLKILQHGKPNYLILLTDGLPTVGVRNPDEIIKNFGKNLKENARLFCFGVGNDVDAFLLDKLASDFRGSSNFVRENENLENEVSAFFEKISNPVLTDCKIDFKNLNAYDIYPKELPDLFVNGSIMVFGRLKAEKNSEVSFTGNSEGTNKQYIFNITAQKQTTTHSFVPTLWANRKIAFLLDQIRNEGDNKELIDEITKLSKKYGIITPYTSYLVKEDERRDLGINQPMIQKKQLFDASQGYAPLSMEQKESMVTQSITLGKMKNSSKTGNYGSLKNIDGKVFMLKDDYWIDTDYEDLKCSETNEVEFGSKEYFSMAEKDSVLKNYFSLSDKIKFIHNGKCYVVK